MSGYCFYSDDALELLKDKPIKVAIDEYAESNKKQTYVICRPLSKDDSTYDYNNAISIFSAGIRPFFVDLGGDDKSFSEYCDDFIEDVSFLAEKYKYRDKIGRKKAWEHLFVPLPEGDFDFQSYSLEKKESRVVELIISLIVGSINDVSKIKLETNNLLDSVKSKIILFDTDQTSFVFKSNIGKRYVVQGLAGSGKTELLLHKLKEVYSNNDDVRIAFTCFNKILSRSMRNRIPEFFDFMRVEKQIDWDNKLFCFNSWGLSKEPKSGMYRYICDYYKIPFGNMYTGTFDELCKRAKKEILEKGMAEDKAFDYVFIDESQDFTDSFIELCELVTSKKVYVAGDVFQNIFRPIDDNVNRADMVLKKCYRTDPKNLMFSHALGMGLYEKPVLRWLKHSEWESCGYRYEEVDDGVSLSRDPLRRFEDIPSETTTETNNKDTIQPTTSVQSETIASPVNGVLLPLSDVKDKAFASGILGGGIAVVPSTGEIVSPVDGFVTVAFKTGHAIGLLSDEGAEILIHIGLDTVQLDGQYFDLKVEQNQHVKKGDLLVVFDLDAIVAAGFDVTTPIIITNSTNYEDVIPTEKQETQIGDRLITLL